MSATREIQNQILRAYGISPIYSRPTAQHISDMLSDKNTTVEQVQAFMRAEFNSYPPQTADYTAKLIVNANR